MRFWQSVVVFDGDVPLFQLSTMAKRNVVIDCVFSSYEKDRLVRSNGLIAVRARDLRVMWRIPSAELAKAPFLTLIASPDSETCHGIVAEDFACDPNVRDCHIRRSNGSQK